MTTEGGSWNGPSPHAFPNQAFRTADTARRHEVGEASRWVRRLSPDSPGLKIFLHDYCGHPFQVQLSRWLAANGHRVHHCYSRDIESPRGNLLDAGDGLEIAAIGQGRPIPKYDIARRALQEWRYASLASAQLRTFGPDIVISGNAPPAIQAALQRAAHKSGAAFVYWLQDIYSNVLERMLTTRVPAAGRFVSNRFRAHEFGVMAKSEAVVVISEDLVEHCRREGVAPDRIVVQHNWAPLAEILPTARDNAWARAHGLTDKFVFLFSGTLGLKHNPRHLSGLAEYFHARENVVIAVVSQGVGRTWLEEERKRKGLCNLKLFDFQPFDQLSNVLGSADVLMAILEPFAGVLSVPSKILSYLCAERPLLAALPPENLSSRIIERAGAGKVTSPLDEHGFRAAADALMSSPELRRAFAARGRAYAERTFDIDRIGHRFLDLFEQTRRARRAQGY